MICEKLVKRKQPPTQKYKTKNDIKQTNLLTTKVFLPLMHLLYHLSKDLVIPPAVEGLLFSVQK